MPTGQIRKAAFYGVLAVFFFLVGFDLWRIYHFIDVGKRFTAADGQTLCERVQKLEARTGLFPDDCTFSESKK